MAMTQIEMYENIMSIIDEAEVQAFCSRKIMQLKNKKATSKALKPEDEELRAAVATFFSDHDGEVFTAKQVAEEMNITSSKASGVLTAMHKNGIVNRYTPEDRNKPYQYGIDTLAA